MFVLKLPPFSPCRVAEGKRAAISNQTCISQKRGRSYIVLAIVYVQIELKSQEIFFGTNWNEIEKFANIFVTVCFANSVRA